MPFPTATVTPGSGLTVNTLPNAGQATMANSLGVVIANDQSPIPVTPSLPPLAAKDATVAAITTALGPAPAQDGTDATGVTPPAGAVGIRGWLSSIWNKLNVGIAIPVGAATAAGVAAIVTALGAAPAQDGTDATGVTPPAGAVGLRGWTSSIWNKLNTGIALPTGAATNAGSASIATTQVSVTTSNTQIVPARPGRAAVTIRNVTGTGPISIGLTGLTVPQGFVLMGVPGDSITIPTQAQVCGTVSSTAQTVCVLETYT
jgi:hypothetical protein